MSRSAHAAALRHAASRCASGAWLGRALSWPIPAQSEAALNDASFYRTQVHELKLEAPFVACEDEKDRECVQCSQGSTYTYYEYLYS